MKYYIRYKETDETLELSLEEFMHKLLKLFTNIEPIITKIKKGDIIEGPFAYYFAKNWGGKRKGAGRPKGNINIKTRFFRLTDKEHILVKRFIEKIRKGSAKIKYTVITKIYDNHKVTSEVREFQDGDIEDCIMFKNCNMLIDIFYTKKKQNNLLGKCCIVK